MNSTTGHCNEGYSEESENIQLETLNQRHQQQTTCYSDNKFPAHNENGETDQKSPRDFDDVLEIVGSVGNFQRFILYGMLVPLSIFEAVFTLNLWFLIDEPNHWCQVPGRDELGLSVDAWKNLTIPRTETGEFSKCTMFNTTLHFLSTEINGTSPLSKPTTIECTSGWEYDFSVANYRSILTDYNWVCDKSHWSTWVHTSRNTGRAVGTFLLGLLADKIGRKPVFIITLIFFSFGRAISLYFAYDVVIFMAFVFLVGWSSPMFAISVNTIGIELSGKEYRAWIYSFTWMTIVIGLVIVPCIALITPNWFVLGWTTILLGSITYLLLPYIPESPRWLLSMGRVDEVVKILRRVAQWNGTDHKITDDDLRKMLHGIVNENQSQMGGSKESSNLFKLFSRKRLAMHTLLVTFTWLINGLMFDGVTLNSLNLHGNRYLNLVLVLVMEVPGGFFGGILSDKFGRRWMQVVFFCLTGVACIVAACTSEFAGGPDDSSGGYTIAVVVAANVAKFTTTMSFLIIYLQAAELLPTT